MSSISVLHKFAIRNRNSLSIILILEAKNSRWRMKTQGSYWSHWIRSNIRLALVLVADGGRELMPMEKRE